MQDPGQLSVPGVPDSPARGSATLSAVSHLSAEQAILFRQGPPLPLFQTIHSLRPGPCLVFSSVSKAKAPPDTWEVKQTRMKGCRLWVNQALCSPEGTVNQQAGWGLQSGADSAVLVSVLCGTPPGWMLRGFGSG